MIAVVVPAYNEEKQIGRVIRGLFEHGYNNVIVVNDGSTDNTEKIAKDAGAIVLNHVLNRGQGAALETGNRYALNAGAEIVVHFDADGQFNPLDIAGAVRLLREKSLDVVLGSRFLDNRSKMPGLKKHIIFPIARLINLFVTGVWLSDVHNGFRVLTKFAVEKISIMQDGMAHNSEIVEKIKRYDLKFKEYPVEVSYHEFGQGLGGGFRVLIDLLLSKLF